MVAKGTKPEHNVSRRQRRTSATRVKLMDAARAVFAEKGLDLTRIDEITERADVGKGTFYYHFNSKDELVNELIKQMLDQLVAVLEDKCSNAPDLEGFLDTLLGAHIEFFCKRWEDFVLYFQGRTDLTLEVSYSGIETPFLDYLTHIEALLASVLKRGLPQPVLRRIACAVVGFVSGYYSFAAIGSKGEDIDQTFRSLRGAMVSSLARFIQEAAPSGGANEGGAGVT